MEEDKKKENCEIEKIDLPNKICQASCKICASRYLKEIHLLKENGAQLLEIVKICKDKYNLNTCASSLSHHFRNYNEIKKNVTAQIIDKDLVDDAMKKAAHSSAVIGLIDRYLIMLEKRFTTGLVANISDFEKLMNIRYKLLDGGSEEDNNLTVTFENAINKYKIDINQRSLFDSNEPQTSENSQERKEAETVEGTLQN